jgi:hypothetical protein
MRDLRGLMALALLAGCHNLTQDAKPQTASAMCHQW